MVKIIDIMKKLNPDEVDCLKKEFQERNKIISELEYKLSEKFKNCYWCKKSDELIKLQKKYEYLEGWHDAVLEESSEYESKIADLEAKLKESKKAFDTICAKYDKKSEQIFWIIKRREECSDAYSLLSKENDQLKQQLEEKDKEIEELNHKLNVEQPCLLMNYKDMVDMLKQSQNQTAIAELEKAKNKIYGLKYNDNACLNKNDSIEDCVEIIDQQIKSLKGDSHNEN